MIRCHPRNGGDQGSQPDLKFRFDGVGERGTGNLPMLSPRSYDATSIPQEVTITEGFENWQFPAVTIRKQSTRSAIPASAVAQKTSIDPPEGYAAPPQRCDIPPKSDVNPPKSYGNRFNQLICQKNVDGES
jgi:hypothetical protein